MKAIVAALLCAMSLGALAQSDRVVDDKMTGCILSGAVFERAATFRDHGRSPEEALKTIETSKSSGKYGVSVEFIKNAINLVYFDPGFTYARGQELAGQMRQLCLRDGKPQFQPLK